VVNGMRVLQDRKLLTLELQAVLHKAEEMSQKVLSWLSWPLPS